MKENAGFWNGGDWEIFWMSLASYHSPLLAGFGEASQLPGCARDCWGEGRCLLGEDGREGHGWVRGSPRFELQLLPNLATCRLWNPTKAFLVQLTGGKE